MNVNIKIITYFANARACQNVLSRTACIVGPNSNTLKTPENNIILYLSGDPGWILNLKTLSFKRKKWAIFKVHLRESLDTLKHEA